MEFGHDFDLVRKGFSLLSRTNAKYLRSAILTIAQILLNRCLEHHGTHGYPSRLRNILKLPVDLLGHTDFDLNFFGLIYRHLESILG